MHESDEFLKDFRVTLNGNKGKEGPGPDQRHSLVAVFRTFVSVSGGVLEATSQL